MVVILLLAAKSDGGVEPDDFDGGVGHGLEEASEDGGQHPEVGAVLSELREKVLVGLSEHQVVGFEGVWVLCGVGGGGPTKLSFVVHGDPIDDGW